MKKILIQSCRETADLVTLTEKPLMENFIFCAVSNICNCVSKWKITNSLQFRPVEMKKILRGDGGRGGEFIKEMLPKLNSWLIEIV